ncbi:hypothetical protein ABT160_04755 [Streptomyces sp. NPDC001941]|uniref:hypothetical protein n=1 Tax=Streptomyces sp. NPDC001941 TaxID=3154659 RepID=UPI0033341243
MQEYGATGDSGDEPGESFEDLISGIETEMTATRLHKQGAYAIAAARIAGTVFSEALTSGVPYELAKEMALDTWNSVMGLTLVESEASEVGGGD